MKAASPALEAEVVRDLSCRLLGLLAPVRILEAVRWDEKTGRDFLHHQGKRLPQVDRDYYRARPLPFDADDLCAALNGLQQEVVNRLGRDHPAARIMCRILEEHGAAIAMLQARGSVGFNRLSVSLYGSADETVVNGVGLAAVAETLIHQLPDDRAEGATGEGRQETLNARQAAYRLQLYLDEALGMPGVVRVDVGEGLLSDALSGSKGIRLRAGAVFTERDLRALLAHEGLVHVLTGLNAAAQPYCLFLAKGGPSATVSQEGLALLMELVTLSCGPDRLRRIANRVRAIQMAQQGADFIEVYRFFLQQEENESPEGAYQRAARVFRGSLPRGLPFTKDVAYLKGLIGIQATLQSASACNGLAQALLLLCGKVALPDLPQLAILQELGLLDEPRLLPSTLRDAQALSTWFCFADFFHNLQSL